MSDPIEALILDLLEFVGPESRPYDQVIDAWRTSCPRLPVWEEACDRGLVARCSESGEAHVTLTPLGRTHLDGRRPRWSEPVRRPGAPVGGSRPRRSFPS